MNFKRGESGARTHMPAHHRPNAFQERPLHQFEYLSKIDTLGLHSTTLPTFLDKIRLIVKAEREGFEPSDPLLSFLRGLTIVS